MARNNIVELTGNLGKDPITYNPNTDREFVVLRLATTDSFKNDKGEWIEKEPVWHSVLVFAPSVMDYARAYKKGDRMKITGSLSYRIQEVKTSDQNVEKFTMTSIVANRVTDARLPRKAATVNN